MQDETGRSGIMPRPIITDKRKKSVIIAADIRPVEKTRSASQTNLLNKKRSDRYLATITDLDTGGHTSTEETREAIVAAIRDELPEVTIEEFPVGIVACCYLGDPYEVHSLSISGGIIYHYEVSEPMPAELERARSLALHPNYAFIEVYRDGTMRAVEKNGTVIVLRG